MEKLNDIEKKQMKKHIIRKAYAGKKRGTSRKKIVALAATFLVAIQTFGLTFPALAENIPIIREIFGRVDLHGIGRLTDLSDYATLVGEVQYSSDYAITLSESIFDGERIYLTFLIEAEEDIITNGGLVFDFLNNPAILVDGVEDRFAIIAMDYHPGEDNTTQIAIVMLTPNVAIDEDSEVEVIFNISQLMGMNMDNRFDLTTAPFDRLVAEGEWNFRVVVDNLGRSFVELNQTITQEGYELYFYDLTLSPVGMRINYSLKTPFMVLGEPAVIEEYFESIYVNVFFNLTDNLGREIVRTTGTKSIEHNRVRGNQSFASPNQSATHVIVTPVIHVMSEMVTSQGTDRMETVEVIQLDPLIIDLP